MATACMPEVFSNVVAHHLPEEPAGHRMSLVGRAKGVGMHWSDGPSTADGVAGPRIVGSTARRPVAPVGAGRQADRRHGCCGRDHCAGVRRRGPHWQEPDGSREKRHEAHAHGGPQGGNAGDPHGRGKRQRPHADPANGAGLPEAGGKAGRPKEMPDELYTDRDYDSESTRWIVRWLGIEPHIVRREDATGQRVGEGPVGGRAAPLLAEGAATARTSSRRRGTA